MPIDSSLGSIINLDEVDGLIAPDSAEEKKNIVKRVVRVGLFDRSKRELLYNCAYVNAYSKNDTNWNFKAPGES